MSQIKNLIKQNFQLAVSAFGNWKNTYRGKSIVLPFFILPLPPRFLNGLGCILQAHIIDNWIKRSFSSYWLQKQTSNKCTTLQRQNAEISKQIFPEKDYRGLSPNFHINTSVCDLYIFPRSVCLFCLRKYVDQSWDYINRSQTHECGNWGWGRAIPRKGIPT